MACMGRDMMRLLLYMRGFNVYCRAGKTEENNVLYMFHVYIVAIIFEFDILVP